MPFFFILPAYVALLVGMIGLALAVRFVPRFRPACGYIVGGAVGTLVGFVIINTLVVVVGVAPAWLAQKFTFPDWLQQISRYFVIAALFIGPFVGSALGVFLGFAAGIYFVFKRRSHAPNQSSQPTPASVTSPAEQEPRQP